MFLRILRVLSYYASILFVTTCLPSCSNVQVGKHAVKEIIVGQNELSSLKIPATSDT